MQRQNVEFRKAVLIPSFFKIEVVHLVAEQGYAVRQTTEAIGVGRPTLNRWLRQYRQE